MGKPVAEAAAEVDKCAWNCEFYAAQAERFLADEPVETDALVQLGRLPAAGRGAGHHALELPYWQVLGRPGPDGRQRRPAQALPNVPRCALATEELFARAGFPTGCSGPCWSATPR